METKEFKIQVPEGYEIDEENSTFKKVKFKKIETKSWYIRNSSNIDSKNMSPIEEKTEVCISIGQLSHLKNLYKD